MSVDKVKKKPTIVSFRLKSKKERQLLEEYAKKREKTLSDYIRTSIFKDSRNNDSKRGDDEKCVEMRDLLKFYHELFVNNVEYLAKNNEILSYLSTQEAKEITDKIKELLENESK